MEVIDMLGHGYIEVGINNGGVVTYHKLPNPIEITENYTNIENENKSESGYDLVMVTRLQKRSWEMTLQVSNEWLATIKSWANKNRNTIRYKGEIIDVRTRINSAQLAQYSEFSELSNGFYTVSLTFIEI